MASPDSSNGGVSFTVKEMLAQLDTKIDRIDEKLDNKVDRAEFDRIYGQVTNLSSSLNHLESQVRTQDQINAALAKKAREVQEQSATNFTRGEKVAGVIMALAALGIQVYVATGGVG